jgi:hypothetical protein
MADGLDAVAGSPAAIPDVARVIVMNVMVLDFTDAERNA